MHDVESSAGERRREVGLNADREPDAASARDGHGGPECDQRCFRAVTKRAAAGREIGRPVRRRKDGDGVTAFAERVSHASNVLVDVVGL